MRLTLLDVRQLAAYTYRPADNRFFNPATGGFETPFVPFTHLVPLVATAMPGTPAGRTISADTGQIADRTDVVTVICTTTGTGNTIAWVADVDVIPGPPFEFTVRGGWVGH